jgi:hypothetical protein
MPVDRAYISPLLTSADPEVRNIGQAAQTLANQSDAIEKASGLSIQVGGKATAANAAVTAPPASSAKVTAGSGHFLVQIAAPGSNTPMVQHQLRSATDSGFGQNVTIYTLGFGQLTLDVVDPGVTKYWALRSQLQGSTWNAWALISGPLSGAFTSGALKTS